MVFKATSLRLPRRDARKSGGRKLSALLTMLAFIGSVATAGLVATGGKAAADPKSSKDYVVVLWEANSQDGSMWDQHLLGYTATNKDSLNDTLPGLVSQFTLKCNTGYQGDIMLNDDKSAALIAKGTLSQGTLDEQSFPGGAWQASFSKQWVTSPCPPPIKTATPVNPTVVVVCGADNDQVTPVITEGIVYTLDGLNVTAKAAEGYKLPDALPSGWSWNNNHTKAVFTAVDANTPCVPTTKTATPVDPTVALVCGPNNDEVTPGTTEGITYTSDGSGATWNIYAAAQEGYKLPDTLPVGWTWNDDHTKAVFTHVDSNDACPPPPPPTNIMCTTTSAGPVSTNLSSVWVPNDMMGGGSYEYVAGALRMTLNDANAKVNLALSTFTPTPLALIGDLGVTATHVSGYAYGPGLNLYVDLDGNTATSRPGWPSGIDGTLVYEEVYGTGNASIVWLSGGTSTVISGAPHTSGGGGYASQGTINDWLAKFPNAVVKAVLVNDGRVAASVWDLTKVTVGCVDYTFNYEPPKDAVADVTITDTMCMIDGSTTNGTASPSGLVNATLSDSTVTSTTWSFTFKATEGHLFANGTDTFVKSGTFAVKDCALPKDAVADVTITPMACSPDGTTKGITYGNATASGLVNATLTERKVSMTDYSLSFVADKGHQFANGETTMTISGKFKIVACSGPDKLASTGAEEVGSTIALAALLLAAGGSLLISRRRRNRGDTMA